MKLRTLDRIQKAQQTWEYLVLSLEVINYVSQGRVMRAMQNYARRPKPVSTKRPADYTIKVKSERRPIR